MSSITTEWKSPKSIKQDHTYKLVNGGTCYQFYDLNDIKKDDLHYAWQSYYKRRRWSRYDPWCAGSHYKRASPIIYAYNYGFNIPNDAVIESVELERTVEQRSAWANGWRGTRTKMVKLKTTASTTDRGKTGKNYIRDNDKEGETWYCRKWHSFTTKITQKECDVKLTPKLINSSNFGQIFQATGKVPPYDIKRYQWGWVDACVAKLRIRVTYSYPSKVVNLPKEPLFKIEGSIVRHTKTGDKNPTGPLKELSLDFPEKYAWLQIKYTQQLVGDQYVGGKTPEIRLTNPNNIYLFSEKKKSAYTVQSMNVKSVKNTKESKANPPVYYSYIQVFPALPDKNGEITVSYKQKKKETSFGVPLPVKSWKGCEGDFTLDGTSQGCIIVGNTFDTCWSKYGGGYQVTKGYENIYGSYEGSAIDKEGYAIEVNMDKKFERSITISDASTGYVLQNSQTPTYTKGFKVKTPQGEDITEYFTLTNYSYDKTDKNKQYYHHRLNYDFGKNRNKYGNTFSFSYYQYRRLEKKIYFNKGNVHKNTVDPKKEQWCIAPKGYVAVHETFLDD